MARWREVWTTSFIALSLGCASAPRGGPGLGEYHEALPQLGEESADRAEFNVIEKLLAEDHASDALARMRSFSQIHSNSPLRPAVDNLHGLYLLKNHQAKASIRLFKRALKRSRTDPNFGPYVEYNLAAAYQDAGMVPEALAMASQISEERLDPPNRIKLRYLKASLGVRQRDYTNTTALILESGQSLSNAQFGVAYGSFEELLRQCAEGLREQPPSPETLQQWRTQYAQSSFWPSFESQLSTPPKALPLINSPPVVAEARILPAGAEPTFNGPTLSEQTPCAGNAVGVLLPLSGKFRKIGLQSLQAVVLAWGGSASDLAAFLAEPATTEANASPPAALTLGPYQLHVRDSGATAEIAIRALDELVFERHVGAVVGPLLSKGVDAISLRAAALGVPLLSLARKTFETNSRSSTLPALDYVFQAGFTLQLQTYELARLAIQERNLKRFAILYPEDQLGREAASYFGEAVSQLGGRINAAESYRLRETDFRSVIDRLTGVAYPETRGRELAWLAQERALNHITQKNRRTEKYYALRPVVDFEAVFIADEAKTASLIFPTFSYKDVERMTFLGLAQWNVPDLVQRAQNYAPYTFFVNLFLPNQTPASLAQSFTQQYQAQFGIAPTVLEALAYDAGLVLKSALEEGGVEGLTRSTLRNRLKSNKTVAGATGQISYRGGHFLRRLSLMEIRRGRIVPVR